MKKGKFSYFHHSKRNRPLPVENARMIIPPNPLHFPLPILASSKIPCSIDVSILHVAFSIRMKRVSNDEFLAHLAGIYNSKSNSGHVTISFKNCTSIPVIHHLIHIFFVDSGDQVARKSTKVNQQKASANTSCLIRATSTKKSDGISTTVDYTTCDLFQKRLTQLMRASMLRTKPKKIRSNST